MKKLTYETYLADPQRVQEQILDEARRMRAEALKRSSSTRSPPSAAACSPSAA
jgi:hypothetical protein